jgi:hypothetical protein
MVHHGILAHAARQRCVPSAAADQRIWITTAAASRKFLLDNQYRILFSPGGYPLR